MKSSGDQTHACNAWRVQSSGRQLTPSVPNAPGHPTDLGAARLVGLLLGEPCSFVYTRPVADPTVSASTTTPAPAPRLRLGHTLLAASIVYLNIAALNAQFAANYAHVPALPVIDLLADPFFLFGMFNGYQREVQELALQGQREGAWVPLAAAEFFPGPAHEHALWAQASRRVGELLTPRAIVRERARFLERIRLRHNALHPERRVERVRVGFLTWPKSRAGRDALRTKGRENFVLDYGQ